MDDDLTYIRSQAAGYADYGDEDAARLSDQQIRARLGEALVGVRERLGLTGPAVERLDASIFHCEFGDQRLIRALGLAVGHLDLAAAHAADRALLGLAERATAVTADELPSYLDAIDAAFAARDGQFKKP